MAFRNLMAKLGAGNATVDAVLDTPTTTPGGTVTGTVHLTGGQVAQEINELRVSLQATVEVESGDHEWKENVTFGTAPIAGAGRIEAGARAAVPFSFPVPWQCPFTSLDGWSLRGRVNELEVTFLASPHGVEVVLEVDRRGGLLTEGRDVGGRLHLSHGDTDVSAVAAQLDAAVRQLGGRRGWF
jgi:sporulation-control protein spo0M